MTNSTFLIFLTLYAMIHLSTECLPETSTEESCCFKQKSSMLCTQKKPKQEVFSISVQR